MSKTIHSERDASVVERADSQPSLRGVLAGLSLSMLLSSLGTSIANVALPTLAEAFGVALQQVQWVVLAYLLATELDRAGAPASVVAYLSDISSPRGWAAVGLRRRTRGAYPKRAQTIRC